MLLPYNVNVNLVSIELYVTCAFNDIVFIAINSILPQ